jgi:hypothetical protein
MTSVVQSDKYANSKIDIDDLDEVLRDDPVVPDLTARFGDDSAKVQREIVSAILDDFTIAKMARDYLPASAFINNAHRSMVEAAYSRLDESGTLPDEGELQFRLTEQFRESKSLPHLLGELATCLHFRSVTAINSRDYWRQLIVRMAKDAALAGPLREVIDGLKRGTVDHAKALGECIQRISEIDAAAGSGESIALLRRRGRLSLCGAVGRSACRRANDRHDYRRQRLL